MVGPGASALEGDGCGFQLECCVERGRGRAACVVMVSGVDCVCGVHGMTDVGCGLCDVCVCVLGLCVVYVYLVCICVWCL